MLAGEPLAARPWHERRSALEAALPTAGGAVSLIDVFDADPVVHDRLVALGFEGSVLKRRDGRYLAWPALTQLAQAQDPSEQRRRSSRSRSPIAAASIVERIGCRAADDPDRLTWATVWHPAHRMRLTRDPVSAIGRDATVTYTHRTVAGALREARLTDLH